MFDRQVALKKKRTKVGHFIVSSTTEKTKPFCRFHKMLGAKCFSFTISISKNVAISTCQWRILYLKQSNGKVCLKMAFHWCHEIYKCEEKKNRNSLSMGDGSRFLFASSQFFWRINAFFYTAMVNVILTMTIVNLHHAIENHNGLTEGSVFNLKSKCIKVFFHKPFWESKR